MLKVGLAAIVLAEQDAATVYSLINLVYELYWDHEVRNACLTISILQNFFVRVVVQ